MKWFKITVLFVLSWSVKGFAAEVVCTTTFLADIAKNLAPAQEKVVSLLPSGADPHIYEPVPADARLISEARLIITNGLNLEGWIDKLLVNASPTTSIVPASTGVTAISNPDHPGSYDPHAWMNPLNGIIYAQNIAKALQRLYPESSQNIASKLSAYIQKLNSLDIQIAKLIQSIPVNARTLVTSHDAFRYYGNRYGVQVHSILGTTTDADVQTSDMQSLTNIITQLQLKAIFIESTINPKLMQQIAKDNGIALGGKLFADSLGPKGSGADSYLGMLITNTLTLVNGLKGTTDTNVGFTIPGFMLWVWVFFVASAAYVAYRMRLPKHYLPKNTSYTLNIEGVNVGYDGKSVLTNTYATLSPGYVYGLIGQNGSGKSTLFKAILGLVQPQTGKIELASKPINWYKQHIAYVPQKEEIDWSFPATVTDVVRMGRIPHKGVFERLNEKDHAIVAQVLAELEIETLAHKQISELSGGQQQRVFIARALCQQAEVYLFDEPFVGIDMETEEKIIGIIRNIAKAGKMVAIIHHDLTRVNDYFDRLILINRRVVAIGDVADVFTTENISQTFSGAIGLLNLAEQMKHPTQWKR